MVSQQVTDEEDTKRVVGSEDDEDQNKIVIVRETIINSHQIFWI